MIMIRNVTGLLIHTGHFFISVIFFLRFSCGCGFSWPQRAAEKQREPQRSAYFFRVDSSGRDLRIAEIPLWSSTPLWLSCGPFSHHHNLHRNKYFMQHQHHVFSTNPIDRSSRQSLKSSQSSEIHVQTKAEARRVQNRHIYHHAIH